ncbi:unnamed protein product [Euphydryas editha]|uniref:SAM domain-containing protein n=1 Tax=Euphydryas editha TaxID=104508 RepID=A0AAU9TFN8_EUPED|nr:unnamed protein product [Euphydryas editha]
MQQQLYQQEQQQQQQQPGAQDATGHQMVLCPVRVVYETQMLVQPGEQIQPNQTIFINPQNPPPWIQNRAVQNQVIYVQHVPNYVQQTQQHIDPNQLYIQNYGYQNLQQMFVQNHQEQIRPMQMTPANIAPNQQAGIGQNVQAQRLVPNISTMPNTYSLVNTMHSQNNPMNRQTTQSQIANVNEIVSNVKQEIVGQHMYRQVPQAIPQDTRNQMQQTVAIVPNNIQRPTNTYEQNVVQMQPIPQQNTSNIQTTYQNGMISVQDARKVPVAVNKNINYNVVNPNISVKGPQTFRPIQPRTNQIRPNTPHFLPSQSAPYIVQSTVPNMTNKNVPRKILPNTVQVPNNIAISNSGKIEVNNVSFNRKRKSESPDEIHKKISISNSPDNPIIIKKIENIPNQINCSEIGVNTSPVHKSDGRITINTMQITPLSPIHAQNTKIKEELDKKPVNNPIIEPQNVIRNNLVVSSVPSTVPSEKEKLVRNTVFTQARGRVLNDKEPVLESNRTEVSINNVTSNYPVPAVSTEVTQIPQTNTNNDNKDVSKVERNERNNAATNPIKVENNPTLPNNTTVTEENKVKNVPSNIKATDEVKVKEDKDFILTHVLDGYVIQESNIAFPIRKPLKEKTLPNNPDGTEPNEIKEIKVEKDTVKNNSKILNISHLHIKDIETVVKSEKVNDKDNPFRTLKPSVVKSWTAEQLESHLTKFDWNDTVSVLQEHEIDGESLLLVSKGQLLTIGVKEEHADIINEFVRS